MALYKPCTDLPANTLFSTRSSRKGYWLNQSCTSLMKVAAMCRCIGDTGTYIVHCDEKVDGRDQVSGVSLVDVSIDGVERPDRAVFAEILEPRGPTSRVATIRPCHGTLHSLLPESASS